MGQLKLKCYHQAEMFAPNLWEITEQFPQQTSFSSHDSEVNSHRKEETCNKLMLTSLEFCCAVCLFHSFCKRSHTNQKHSSSLLCLAFLSLMKPTSSVQSVDTQNEGQVTSYPFWHLVPIMNPLDLVNFTW